MSDLTLCIPGPWQDRDDFMRRVITFPPEGRFMYLGGLLADVPAKEHVKVVHVGRESEVAGEFERAGRGELSDATLQAIAAHGSFAFLQFPTPLPSQLAAIVKFCELFRAIGGIAVKIESSGIAHEFDTWLELLAGNAFDQYRSVVALAGDERSYYSCGMHLFDLPDCSVPRSMAPDVAADVMNRFNMYVLLERPRFEDGHTFSVDENSPRFRLKHVPDVRHAEDDLRHNPQGLWLVMPTGHH